MELTPEALDAAYQTWLRECAIPRNYPIIVPPDLYRELAKRALENGTTVDEEYRAAVDRAMARLHEVLGTTSEEE